MPASSTPARILPQHMSTALAFQYNAVDAVSMEHMGQKQAGGPPADDSHLRSRCHLHVH